MIIEVLKNLKETPSKGSFINQGISIQEIEILEQEFNGGNLFPKALRELLFLAGKFCIVFDYGLNESQQEMQLDARADLPEYNRVIKRRVRQALGFHPLFIVNGDNTNELLKFKSLINKTSYIGEIGLDFSKEGIQTKNKQIEVFQNILSIIKDCKDKKILSLHSRAAEQEVLFNLLMYNIKFAIFHWYSGKIELIKSIIDAGYYFSINPAMIKSKRGNEIINEIPLNRILVESDGPFIDLNGKPILPYQLNDVYDFFANKYSMSIGEFRNIVKENFYGIISSLNTS